MSTPLAYALFRLVVIQRGKEKKIDRYWMLYAQANNIKYLYIFFSSHVEFNQMKKCVLLAGVGIGLQPENNYVKPISGVMSSFHPVPLNIMHPSRVNRILNHQAYVQTIWPIKSKVVVVNLA